MFPSISSFAGYLQQSYMFDLWDHCCCYSHDHCYLSSCWGSYVPKIRSTMVVKRCGNVWLLIHETPVALFVVALTSLEETEGIVIMPCRTWNTFCIFLLHSAKMEWVPSWARTSNIGYRVIPPTWGEFTCCTGKHKTLYPKCSLNNIPSVIPSVPLNGFLRIFAMFTEHTACFESTASVLPSQEGLFRGLMIVEADTSYILVSAMEISIFSILAEFALQAVLAFCCGLSSNIYPQDDRLELEKVITLACT